MARLIGVEVPDQKKIGIALRYIYGIGPTTALEVCQKANVDPNVRAKDLKDEQLAHLATALQGYRVEGDLRREVQSNIKRLKEIGSYRGLRHSKHLPVRGQRTKTNSRTVRGNKRVTMGSGKSKAGLQKT